MRKYSARTNDPTPRPRTQSRLYWRFAILLILGVVVGPYAYEGGMSVYAQWRTLMGTYTVAETPRINQLCDAYRVAAAAINERTHPYLGGSRWQAKSAVPLAIGWAAAMGFVFLHKTR